MGWQIAGDVIRLQFSQLALGVWPALLLQHTLDRSDGDQLLLLHLVCLALMANGFRNQHITTEIVQHLGE